MNNYTSLSRLINELNRTLGITSIVKHEYIHNYFIKMYGENW